MYDNSMRSEDAWFIFVLFLVALLIVLFIIRGILLWYWKIDKIVENQNKTNELLEKILNKDNTKPYIQREQFEMPNLPPLEPTK